MDTTLENYTEGQDFGTLRVTLFSGDDDIHLHATGNGAYLDLPLYSYEARELIEILTPLAEEHDLD